MQKHLSASGREFHTFHINSHTFPFPFYMCLFLNPSMLFFFFYLSDFTRRSLLLLSIHFFLVPGESACKHMFKIPLCNLVGRSIERPLKSPLVNKVLTTPGPTMVAPTPLISATHSLSLSRMEIKEIASRTRKELLGKTDFL